MKLISWNVNGVRAWSKKDGSLAFVEKEDPDVFCIQESKAQPDQFEEVLSQYPHKYVHSAERKGYSGTAMYSKQEALNVEFGINVAGGDTEGRVISAEFDSHFVVTVYTPNTKNDLSRLPYRYNEWDISFLKHLQNLEKKKPVIACGDFNVAHQPIDLARPDANKTTEKRPGNAGFTDQERERFSDFMNAGFIDSFRQLYPEVTKYSWWSMRSGARPKNIGWRIDYFILSGALQKNLLDAHIYDQVLGSDHCPIGVELNL